MGIRCLLFAVAVGAWAQTISTSASRTVTLAPDNAGFSVSVTADQGTTLDQVLAALKDTGITAANLVSAGTSMSGILIGPNGQLPTPKLSYGFQLAVPFAGIQDFSAKLDAAGKALAASKANLQSSFYFAASDSAYQQARQNALPDLVAAARKNAGSLASAGGLALGALQSLNETTPPANVFAGLLPGIPSVGAGLQTTFAVYASFAAQPVVTPPCDGCQVPFPTRPPVSDTGGITGTASRSITLAPDSAVFAIAVTAGLSTTLDEAVAVLKGTGITAADLVGAGYSLAGITYQFALTVPYANAKDVSGKLDAAGNGNVRYSFYLTASASAVQAARQMLLPDLVAEARQNAESLAGAGGLSVGALLSLNDNLYMPVPVNIIPVATTSPLSGLSAFAVGGTSSAGSGLQATFSISARFALQK